MNRITLILGSNLGNKVQNIKQALSHIKNLGKIIRQSEWIQTHPEGYNSNNTYINMGVIFLTPHSPIKLLHKIKNIEKLLGRINDSSITKHYEDRSIDIDIVFFNKLTFYSSILKIPHKEHVLNRSFSKEILNDLE